MKYVFSYNAFFQPKILNRYYDSNTVSMKVNELEKKILTHVLQFRQINTTQTNKIQKKKKKDVENKIPNVSGLATTAFPNTKIGEVKNKVFNVSSIVKKTVYEAKTSEIERKYLTTADYNKFTNGKDYKSNIYNLVKKSE